MKQIITGILFGLYSSLAVSTTQEQSAALTEPASNALVPMLLALLFIVFIIYVIALVAKKLNLTPNNSEHFKLVSSMSLGGRERIVIIQVQDQQHAIGVTSQSVNHLFRLEQNIVSKPVNLTDNQLVNKINKFFGYQPPIQQEKEMKANATQSKEDTN